MKERRYLQSFMRNPEIHRNFGIWSLLSLLFLGAAFLLETRFGLLSAGFCLLLLGSVFWETFRRYRLLAELSLEMDEILHGNSHVDLSRFSEGELSILASEVHKMTVRLREQAETLQKDKSFLADSLADISHQIRTPLTSINLIANLLSEEDLPQPRRLQLTRELMDLLSRIDWLITTLLKISRLDSGAVELARAPVDLRQLAQKAAAMVAIPMELREQTLVIQGSDSASFLGDVTWSVEAVGNILKNCMEHTPEGGTVTVTVDGNPLYGELVIRDTGPGFSREDLPHLFERFYKGKGAGDSGFGIGLALARMIIQAQNGTVRAANGRSGGAEFTIRFYRSTV